MYVCVCMYSMCVFVCVCVGECVYMGGVSVCRLPLQAQGLSGGGTGRPCVQCWGVVNYMDIN